MFQMGVLQAGGRPVFGSAHEGQAGYGVAPQSWTYIAKPLRRCIDGVDGGGLDRKLSLGLEGPLSESSGPFVGRRIGTMRKDGRLRVFSVDHVSSFMPGLLVRTSTGPRRVDRLAPGDRVLTQDNGMRELRWTGRRRIDGTGTSAPILVRPGALGNHAPVLVSPSQQLVLKERAIRTLFGRDEAVVSIRHLLDGERVVRTPRRDLELVLLQFDDDEVLDIGDFGLDCAAPVELCNLAPEDLAMLNGGLRSDRADPVGQELARGLRIGLTGYESRLLRAMMSADDLMPSFGRLAPAAVPVG